MNWLAPAYVHARGELDESGLPPYDEFAAPDGEVRAHWHCLADALEALGTEGLEGRWQEGQRIVQENGVTYNVYGDPRGLDRPWPLDPIPFILAPGEWERIEAAIKQRAFLLNEILRDIYGPQRLLRGGALPPALLYANPGFLRACHGVSVAEAIHLHSYAADLARSPDGQWWVLADRTQAPSGAGYALENRMVTVRTLPDMMQECSVLPLWGHFQSYRELLLRMAPRHRDNPRVVLLTPGPYNETYFEHAFLAQQLGFTLVEGGDLTVRENAVMLKTLGGLLPVDVILRRQDDSFCDPLELRGDSMLGVPGLLQAVRAGNVAVANALGSGVTEMPALCAFLPGLCRQMLGEELKMPSVATWWCGQEKPFRDACDQLERLVIKQAYPGALREPIFGERLTATERGQLVVKMKAAPYKYVAQEQVQLSTAPVWTPDGLYPRRTVLRVYATASGNGYVVMPGGLCRVSSSMDTFVVSVQRGGGSKDTWVRAAEGAAVGHAFPSPRRARREPLDISRATFDLPSRVADNLFWLGRYAERLESATRVARSVLTRLAQETNGFPPGLLTSLHLMVALEYVPKSVLAEKTTAGEIERAMLDTVHDVELRGGLGWTAVQLRRLAWLLRERISPDTWRVLSRLSRMFGTGKEQAGADEALRLPATLELMAETVLTLSAFSGLVMESMTRGQGWRFLDIGRRLERAMQMAQLLLYGMEFGADRESDCLQSLLEIAESSITYRSRYLTSLQTDLVVDLLLMDEANPRSLIFQLNALTEHIDQLPAQPSETVELQPETMLMLGALSELRLVKMEELVEQDQSGRRPKLERLLRKILGVLRSLADLLTRNYLSHAVKSRRFTT